MHNFMKDATVISFELFRQLQLLAPYRTVNEGAIKKWWRILLVEILKEGKRPDINIDDLLKSVDSDTRNYIELGKAAKAGRARRELEELKAKAKLSPPVRIRQVFRNRQTGGTFTVCGAFSTYKSCDGDVSTDFPPKKRMKLDFGEVKPIPPCSRPMTTVTTPSSWVDLDLNCPPPDPPLTPEVRRIDFFANIV